MQLTIFCKYIYARGLDCFHNPILLEIDIHVRYTMMLSEIIELTKHSIGNCKLM